MQDVKKLQRIKEAQYLLDNGTNTPQQVKYLMAYIQGEKK